MIRAMTIDEQIAYLTKGCVDVVRPGELRAKLERAEKTGRKLTVKVGFDPTAPDLHLGHTVLIRKMKHFQDLGHTVVYVVGSFTALIGDPTGRSKTRPPLTMEEITANAETYKTQIFKILDPQKTVTRFNSEWLEPLGSAGWIRLAAKYNVAQMMERREFKQRYEAGKPIAIHEFLYPLAQAYDSVVLSADVELGGTDQLFNLNVGRDLMTAFDLEAQIVMTTPLLEGLDGVEKMSKSLGNYVGVTESAVRDVRQADVDLRRFDVEVLRVADGPQRGGHPGAAGSRHGGHAASEGCESRSRHAHRRRVSLAGRGRGGGGGVRATVREGRDRSLVAGGAGVGAAGRAAGVPAGADSAEAGGVGCRGRPEAEAGGGESGRSQGERAVRIPG